MAWEQNEQVKQGRKVMSSWNWAVFGLCLGLDETLYGSQATSSELEYKQHCDDLCFSKALR
jgi:hypothetical protein